MTPPLPIDSSALDEASTSELSRLFNTIERIVRDGMNHGHFHYQIKGTVGKGLRRELVIEAGVSHKFIVLPGDLKI